MKIIKGMSNREYRQAEGISKTDLDHIHISPLHYRTYKDSPSEDTAALLIGRAYHKIIGEPETFDSEFAVAPKVDKRTKTGKEAWSLFLESAGERTVITEDDYSRITSMKEAFNRHELAPQLISGGVFENSIFWHDETMDVDCKCRPDCIAADGYLIDFKTAASANQDDFITHAYKYRYHVQAWYYMHGYSIVTGEKPKGFIFIVQEKTPPYAVAVYKADSYFVELGRFHALEDLRVYSECLHTNSWPGYGYNENTAHYEVINLQLPNFALRQFMEKMGK